jgi:hypothetical protein
LVVNGIVYSAAAKDEANEQVKVGLEEMDDTQFIQL